MKTNISTFCILSLIILIGLAASSEESSAKAEISREESAVTSEESCGFLDIFRCFFQQISFSLEVVFFSWDNLDNMDTFKASCHSLIVCQESLKCQKSEKQIELTSNTTKICSEMSVLRKNFKECKKRVDKVRGDCNVGDTCETVFGKDQCLKSFIVDECGMGKWSRFRDNIINLRKPSLPKCDFDQYKD